MCSKMYFQNGHVRIICSGPVSAPPEPCASFSFAVLRHDGDELLHSAVWRVPRPGRAGPAGVEPSAGLPPGAPQVHEHRGTHESGGDQVGLIAPAEMEGRRGWGVAVVRERKSILNVK